MSDVATANRDSKAVLRDKRAQGIAAMGLVTRECDRFRVATPSLRGRTTKYEVWRDDAGCVRCSCLEYEEHASLDTRFRCEHILAVKHFLLARDSEAVVTAQQEQPVAPEVETAPDDRVSADSSAEGIAPENVKVRAELSRSDRDHNEPADTTAPIEAIPRESNVRSLAKHTNPQEQEMNDKRVDWCTVVDILDLNAPDWSHSVRNVALIGDIVAVTAAITIQGVTREGVGTSTARDAIGIKQAEHDALKLAAVKFGIALELEQRESEMTHEESTATQDHSSIDPFATSMADLVRPRQLGMIRALARMAGVDVEEECQSVYRCQPDELSKRAASGVIDHLMSLQQPAAAGMRRAS